MELLNKKKFIYWWISALITGTALFWSYYFGLLHFIWQVDTTYLTTIIGIQYIIGLVILGIMSYKAIDPAYVGSSPHRRLTDHCWFFSEAMMGLGMVGTVIGLIYMSLAFSSINASDINALQIAVVNSYKALGLAFFTNLVGLVASQALKYQTQFIGYSDEE